ncbi:MAG: hypothetical protein PHQ74_12820 [Crocinitomicaceae bacterium]|nr:hypothetical protein [Crocinitomicaceae bacterium]
MKMEKNHIVKRNLNIKSHIKFFGISEYECDLYLENINANRFQNEIRKLDRQQIDLLISMSIEVLSCIGSPERKDVLTAESAFINLVGITSDEFNTTLDNLVKATLYFNSISNRQSTEQTFVSKTHDRIMNEANDHYDSPFSLSNILFISLIALAVIGLMSMCK